MLTNFRLHDIYIRAGLHILKNVSLPDFQNWEKKTLPKSTCPTGSFNCPKTSGSGICRAYYGTGSTHLNKCHIYLRPCYWLCFFLCVFIHLSPNYVYIAFQWKLNPNPDICFKGMQIVYWKWITAYQLHLLLVFGSHIYGVANGVTTCYPISHSINMIINHCFQSWLVTSHDWKQWLMIEIYDATWCYLCATNCIDKIPQTIPCWVVIFLLVMTFISYLWSRQQLETSTRKPSDTCHIKI